MPGLYTSNLVLRMQVLTNLCTCFEVCVGGMHVWGMDSSVGGTLLGINTQR